MAVAQWYVLVQAIARVSWDFTFGSQMAGRKNTGLREPWDPNGRAPRGLRPRCGARTRKNMGYGVKRSPTGPLRQSWRAIDRAKTKVGRERISSAQKQRCNAYRETKKAEAEKIN